MMNSPRPIDSTNAASTESSNWVAKLAKTHLHWWRTEGSGVVVAILDSGADVEHPSLKKSIYATRDFTEEVVKEKVKDFHGHGTGIAGIIAGRKLGEKKPQGIAPKSSLFIGKIFNENGSNWQALERALEWIIIHNEIVLGVKHSFVEDRDGKWGVEQESIRKLHQSIRNTNREETLQEEHKLEFCLPLIRIINLSISGSRPPNSIFRLIHHLLASGVHIITAAGNKGSLSENGVGFPGRYGGVITVGAHNEYGTPLDFSSKGGEVDFLAPGVRVWTSLSKEVSVEKGNLFVQATGTSVATGFISGLAALIISKHLANPGSKTPVNNCEELREHLRKLTVHPGYFAQTEGYGAISTFRDWGNIIDPDVSRKEIFMTYLFSSPEEKTMSEIDDRVDAFRIKDYDFWFSFLETSSGSTWKDKDVILLRRILFHLSCQIGLFLDLDNADEFDKEAKFENPTNPEKGNLIVPVSTLQRFIKKWKGKQLRDGERFFDQPCISIENTRTVFYSGIPGYFVTCRHGYRLEKEYHWPYEEENYRVSEFDNKVLVFGHGLECRQGDPVDSQVYLQFSPRQILNCKYVLQVDSYSKYENDWFVIYAEEVSHAGDKNSKIGSIHEHFLSGREAISMYREQEAPLTQNYQIPQGVFTLGFPLGLPMKFTPDGYYYPSNEGLIQNSLDAFGGNSGSPVYRALDFELVGIHQRGPNKDLDFVDADNFTKGLSDTKSNDSSDELVYNHGLLDRDAHVASAFERPYEAMKGVRALKTFIDQQHYSR